MNPLDAMASGREMHALVAELYPLCRSITGDGVRETLRRLMEEIPLVIYEVPSGTAVFDWTVPEEWNIREAWIKAPDGREIVNFANHNLHVVGYSTPVRKKMSLAELKPRLFSLPDQPDLIPYRTSYYKKTWGFCLPHRDLERLEDGEYEVCIDSTLADGSLTYGECYIPGTTPDEVLISCHTCHPSLANDNLAGIAVGVALAKQLAARPRRLSYRFLFAPATIGSITWLALNQELIPRIKHGLVIACAGDPGSITYKKTRRKNSPIDRAMQHVLKASGAKHRVAEFHPYGYDERQYCSPGVNLPIGCLMRSPDGTFPEYHTSADNPGFIEPEALADTLVKTIEALEVLEHNSCYMNLKPMCEPRLGKYGLYGDGGGQRTGDFDELALLWVLNQSDGENDLLAIAEKSGMPFRKILTAAHSLKEAGLLRRES
ncbi:MAG: aminopeptidase-like protein [Candidatus Pelagisphaera sp.]|jgi:aminopeptidase-like protein